MGTGSQNRKDNMIKMSVSPATTKDKKKVVYVLFQDGEKNAEFLVPGGSLVRNNGFDDEQIRSLSDYIGREHDTIMNMARDVNPLKSFLGK